MAKLIMLEKEFSVEEIFKLHETHCIIRGYAKRTIKWYGEVLRWFNKYFDIKKNIKEVDENVINGYILFCKERGNKKQTINTRLVALRSILNWCHKNDYIDRKIEVKLLKIIKEVKEVYTFDELEKLLKKPSLKKCGFVEYRNWVITNFFLSTACRTSTLLNIKIQDLNIEERIVIYRHTKNKREQIIPLPIYMVKILTEYLCHRKGEGSDYLFCNIYGSTLSNNALGRSLNKYNRKRGVEKTGRHIFRNTFAKIWITNGGDAFSLQKFLGHSTLDVTKRYIEMYSDDLRANLEEYNPINSLIKEKRNYIKIKYNR